MSGLFKLHRLRELGLRSPRIRSGGAAWAAHCYSEPLSRRALRVPKAIPTAIRFSKELLGGNGTGPSTSHPSPRRCAISTGVASTEFELRRDIRFHSKVTAAHWHEEARSWQVTLDDGSAHTARFLITAIGPLSAFTMPRIGKSSTFCKGQSSHGGAGHMSQ